MEEAGIGWGGAGHGEGRWDGEEESETGLGKVTRDGVAASM